MRVWRAGRQEGQGGVRTESRPACHTAHPHQPLLMMAGLQRLQPLPLLLMLLALLLGLGAGGTPREADEASHLRPHHTIDQQLGTPLQQPKVLGQYDQVWSDGNYSGDAERHGRLDTGLLLRWLNETNSNAMSFLLWDTDGHQYLDSKSMMLFG